MGAETLSCVDQENVVATAKKWYASGRCDEAVAHLLAALAGEPRADTVRDYLAWCLVDSGQPGRALEILNLRPVSCERHLAQLLRARCLAETGETDLAEAVVRRLLEERPLWADAMALQGESELRSRRLGEAGSGSGGPSQQTPRAGRRGTASRGSTRSFTGPPIMRSWRRPS